MTSPPAVVSAPQRHTGAPSQRPSRRKATWWTRRNGPNLVAGFGSLVWLAVVAVPLYIMIGSTFRTRDEYLDKGPLALPTRITFDNYVGVFEKNFFQYLANNVIVTLASAGLTLVLAVPTGWAIVRSRSRLVSTGFRMFLLGLAIPAQAVIIPVYLMITEARLYDSLLAVILPTVAFAMPVSVLILVAAMRDVSEELYEAAVLDGASTRRILFQLVVPVTRAGIATVGIYAGLHAWNGLLFPLILTQSENKRVLPMALWQYQAEYSVNVPGLLSAVLLSGLPMFVVYLLARRWLIRGFMGVGGK